MNFIDRKNELARLTALSRRREGGLAVVTGRRRVGKTRLLVEWVERTGGVSPGAAPSSAHCSPPPLAAARTRPACSCSAPPTSSASDADALHAMTMAGGA